jgi:hypothetical protein
MSSKYLLDTLSVEQAQKNVLRSISEDPVLKVAYKRFLPTFSALVCHIDNMGYPEDLYDSLICCAFIQHAKTHSKI